uniref:Nucleoporin Nup188 N-terminal domain-containing protein n=1 Tax=Trichuris muris TaxID=70415 RepID=A0A5S6QJJ7_TRIMR
MPVASPKPLYAEYITAEHVWSMLTSAAEPRNIDVESVIRNGQEILNISSRYFATRPDSSVPVQCPSDFGTVSPVLKTFVEEAATLLQLDFEDAYHCFCCFLLYEFSCDRRDINEVLKERAQSRDLCRAFACYVKTEQVYLIRCCTELIKIVYFGDRSWLDRLGRIASEFFARDSFILKLVAYYEFLRGAQVNRELASPQVISHHLALQSEILIFFVWTFHAFDPDASWISPTLDLFREGIYNVETRNLASIGAAESERLLENVRFLENLLFMKMCSIESLAFSLTSERKDRDSVNHWLDEDFCTPFDQVMSTLCPCKLHASVYMFWAVNREICSLLAESPDDAVPLKGDHFRKFSVIAKEFEWLDSCTNCLKRLKGFLDEDTFVLACGTVYVAVNQCLSLFELDSLGSYEALLELTEVLLCCESIAVDIFATAFSSGIGELFRDTVYQFPCCFNDPLALLAAVASTSSDNAVLVFNLFLKLPCCSEPLNNVDTSSLATLNVQEGDVVYQTKRTHYFGDSTSSLCIPAGTLGTVYDRFNSIQWKMFYNGWHFCISEVNSLRERNDAEAVARKVAVFRLVRQVLQREASLIECMYPYFSLSIFTFSNCREPCLSFSTEMTRLFAEFARQYSEQVLSHLVFSGLIRLSPESSDIYSQLIAKALCDEEGVEFLVAYLQLCVNLLDSQLQAQYHAALLHCASLALFKVLSGCETLSQPLGRRWAPVSFLSMRVVQLCLQALPEMSVTEEDRLRKSELRTLCEQAMLYTNSRSLMLRIISTGEPELSHILCDNRPMELRSTIVDALACAFSNLNSLVSNYVLDEKNPMPPLMKNLFYGLDGHTTPLLATVAKYLYSRLCVRVSIMAVNFLTTAASRFPGTLLSTFGPFMGAFCDIFILRVHASTKEPTLTVQCLRFLSVAIEHQFGLVEQLLAEPQSAERAEPGEESEQVATGGLFTSLTEMIRELPITGDIYLACMDVFEKVWMFNCQSIVGCLKGVDDVWPILCAPLCADELSFLPLLAAPTWNILACEVCGGGKIEGPLRRVLLDVCSSERMEHITKKVCAMCSNQADLSDKLRVLKAFRDFLQATCENCREVWTNAALNSVLANFLNLLAQLICECVSEGDLPLIFVVGTITFIVITEQSFIFNVPATLSKASRILESIAESNIESNVLTTFCMAVLPTLSVALRKCKLDMATDPTVGHIFTLILDRCCLIYGSVLTSSFKPSGDYSKFTDWNSALTAVILLFISVLNALLEKVPSSVTSDLLERYGTWNRTLCLLYEISPNGCSVLTCAVCGFLGKILFDESLLTKVCLGRLVDYLTLAAYDIDDQSSVSRFEAAILFFAKGAATLGREFTSEISAFVAAHREQFLAVCSTFQEGRNTALCVLHLFDAFSELEPGCGVDHFDPVSVMCDCCCKLAVVLLWKLAKPGLVQTDGNLLHLLFLVFTVLLRFTPSLVDFAQGICCVDAEAYGLLVKPDFGQHFITDDGLPEKLTFGQLLHCAQQCAASLRQYDSSKSGVRTPGHQLAAFIISTPEQRMLAEATLECIFCFILSQMSLYTCHPSTATSVGSVVRIEAATEVNQAVEWCLRPVRSSPKVQGRKYREDSIRASPVLNYVWQYANSALRCGKLPPGGLPDSAR